MREVSADGERGQVGRDGARLHCRRCEEPQLCEQCGEPMPKNCTGCELKLAVERRRQQVEEGSASEDGLPVYELVAVSSDIHERALAELAEVRTQRDWLLDKLRSQADDIHYDDEQLGVVRCAGYLLQAFEQERW